VRDVNLERIGAELYGWIIVLAALAMAADWIVANRFYAPRVATGPRPVEEIAESFADSAAAGPGPVPPPVPPAVPPSAPPPGPPPVPPPVPQEVGT
jgi:outer membrane biosynthesis protein TonB